MGKLHLYLGVLVLSTGAFGQSSITGKIMTTDAKPIPSANVLLLNVSDSSLKKGGLTNDSGEYVINLIDTGSYFIRYTAVGFQAWHSPVFRVEPADKSRHLGTQVMDRESKELEAIVVKANKPLYQQQAEGLTVNVESSILSKGSSALQVLERSPGVFIDRQYNSIALNGKNGVMVMLNGKLLRLSSSEVVALLNGMSANNIEKIELLTTPPAKYDAEGSAGMINIVLKKNKKAGTNGSLSLTAGYGRKEKGTVSASISHNTNNLDLYLSYTFSHDKSYSNWFADAYQNVPILGGPETVQYWSTTHPEQNSHDVTLGLGTRLNTKTTIGANVTFNSSSYASTIINHGEFTILPDSLLIMDARINGTNRWKNLISSINLEKKIREGETLNFDLDYLYYKNDNPSTVESYFTNRDGHPAVTDNDSIFSPYQKGFANTDIHVGVFKFDYAKQLSKKVKLEAGGKGTYTRSSSVSGIESLIGNKWVNRSGTNNNMIVKERIAAAYASVNVDLSASAKMVIGARYEYSHTTMDSSSKEGVGIDRKLSKLFPNISFTKKLNEHSELQLSYTKRISRPSYNDLASFVTYNDAASVITGNPLLKPTITNIVRLGYNYKYYSFAVFFSRDDNPIARYQLTASPSGELMYVSPQNLQYQNNITFQTNLPFKVTEWWNMNYGFAGGLRQFKLEHTMEKVKKNYFGYNVYGSETFKLPQGFSAELSGWYNGASYDGSKKVDGFGSVNLGIKKDLKNNKGSLQLSVSDVFMTMNINNYFGALTEEAFSLKNHFSFNTESRSFPIFRLTYTRSWGSNNSKGLRKQDNGSREERERVIK